MVKKKKIGMVIITVIGKPSTITLIENVKLLPKFTPHNIMLCSILYKSFEYI